jgi:hypothetical protein
MCVRSWGLARNRAFMRRQDFGVIGESRPRCPSGIERAPCTLQHSGGCHLGDGQWRHSEIADDPVYTCSAGLSRKIYLCRGIVNLTAFL